MSEDIWYERNPGRRPPYEDASIGDDTPEEEESMLYDEPERPWWRFW